MKLMASVDFNFVHKISSLRKKKSYLQNEEVSNSFKNTLMEVQKILLWDDPFFSCCCVVIVNILFWLINYLDFKFYGIIFTTLLVLTCEQVWMEHFYKYFTKNNSSSRNCLPDSSNSSDESAVEMNTFFKKGTIMLKEFYVKASFLRQSQPGMFCILTCLGFFLLGVIGRSLSSVIAFYILLMLIMTVPGVLCHFLPPYVVKGFSDLFYSSRKESYTDIDDEIEPYLPDTSEETLELLRIAGDPQELNKQDDEDSNDLLLESLGERVSDTTEYICSKLSLYPKPVIMPPSENSLELWDFDSKEKTDFNEMESHGINFESKHFDGDSSDEEFIKGLDLSEKTSKKYKKTKIQQTEQSNLNLITSDEKFLIPTQQKNDRESYKESSSDTESFELISEDNM